MHRLIHFQQGRVGALGMPVPQAIAARHTPLRHGSLASCCLPRWLLLHWCSHAAPCLKK